ncbi:MAG: hypothetical protein QM500_12170 [Methylococcales bacterium]
MNANLKQDLSVQNIAAINSDGLCRFCMRDYQGELTLGDACPSEDCPSHDKAMTLSFVGPFARHVDDDDLCASCDECIYRAGALSDCRQIQKDRSWPALLNTEGSSVECKAYMKIKYPGANAVWPV